MEILVEKFKEVIVSILPVTIIFMILNFTVAPIETSLVIRFLIGALFIIIGLTIFLFGADIGIRPIGAHMGSALTKQNKTWFIIVFGFILGFFVTIAEPDLIVLAEQVSGVTSGLVGKSTLLVVVSIGVGALVVLGLLRVVFNISLSRILLLLYGLILIMALLSSSEFLAISFDAAGATTGSMTVPFILAIGLGVSTVKGGKDSEEDSFGLVAIASAGPIISVLLMSILKKADIVGGVLAYDTNDYNGVFSPFIDKLPHTLFEMFIALLPIVVLFLLCQFIFLKLSKKKFIRIIKGVVYTYIGLVFFLIGVNAGFMEAGSALGFGVASLSYNWILIPVGFVLGFTVIFAEPAVHILTEQVEYVTSRHIRKNVILYSLSIGVAFAVALSMVRIMVPGVRLWHYLLPGYAIALVLSWIVPKIFVGIAFDSGGVASGPLTATFILAFAQGAADAIEGADVLLDAFGVIAMVALTPLIAIQIVGLIYKIKLAKKNAQDQEDDIITEEVLTSEESSGSIEEENAGVSFDVAVEAAKMESGETEMSAGISGTIATDISESRGN